MSALTVIILASIGTFAFRASMLVALAGRRLPDAVQARLVLVGPSRDRCPVRRFTRSRAQRGISFAEVMAAGAAFVAVHRSRNVVHAFVVGLPVIWLAHAVGLA